MLIIPRYMIVLFFAILIALILCELMLVAVELFEAIKTRKDNKNKTQNNIE